MKFSVKKNSVKTEINGNLKVHCHRMADKSELAGQAVTVLAGHQRNNTVILMEDYVFFWLIPECFSWGVLLSVTGLARNSACWNESWFPEGAHNRDLPSNSTIHTTSLSLEKTSLGVVSGSSCHLPLDLLLHITAPHVLLMTHDNLF